jgi:hypothetical protein
MVVHKVPDSAVVLYKCPRRWLKPIRAEERKVARLTRAAERRIRDIRRELDEQCQPHRDRMSELVEELQERHDLPAGLMVHTETGMLLYDAGQGKTKDVPDDVKELDDDELALKAVPEE